MAQITLGLVGYGYWGRLLVNNFQDSQLLRDKAIIQYCCDDSQKRLLEAKEAYPSLKVLDSFDALLAINDLDGVILATPPKTHYELASKALAAGKHVVVEKPLATSIADAKSLVDLAQRHERVLMVDDTYLYATGVQALKDAMGKPEFGELRKLYLQWQTLGKYQECGVVWDLASHPISIANYLFETPPKSVQTIGVTEHKEVYDSVTFSMDYGRVPAMCEVSWFDGEKIRKVTAIGTKQKLIFDETAKDYKLKIIEAGINLIQPDGTPLEKLPNNPEEFRAVTNYGSISFPKIDWSKKPLTAMLEHFVECITLGSTPRSSGASGLNTVKVMVGALASIEQDGARISLEERL